MDRFIGKNAIVTGAGSGSGKAMAVQLVKRGINVVGLGRRINRLEEVKKDLSSYNAKFIPVKCDLTKKEEIDASLKWIFEHVGSVHILINNAGVLERTFLLDCTSEQINKSIALNVIAPLQLSQAVCKNMMENSIQGHILNMIGVAGQVVIDVKESPNIYMVYCATKHALRVITEALRRELTTHDAKIKVTILSPGYVRTELSAGLDLSPEYDNQDMDPDDVAEVCISALETPFYANPKEITFLCNHLQY